MKKKTRKTSQIDQFMSLNYPATLEEYEEDGEKWFGLEVPDLPGVWGHGKTLADAYKSLEGSKRAWFEVRVAKNLPIPTPISEDNFSGKFVLRIPAKLHMLLTKKARECDLSLNQFIRITLENLISVLDLSEMIGSLQKTVNQQTQAVADLSAQMKRHMGEYHTTKSLRQWSYDQECAGPTIQFVTTTTSAIESAPEPRILHKSVLTAEQDIDPLSAKSLCYLGKDWTERR